MCVCVHAYMRKHICSGCAFVCGNLCYTHMYIYLCKHAFKFVCACICIYLYVCICLYTHKLSVSLSLSLSLSLSHTHTHTHTHRDDRGAPQKRFTENMPPPPYTHISSSHPTPPPSNILHPSSAPLRRSKMRSCAMRQGRPITNMKSRPPFLHQDSTTRKLSNG
jgi:hypothetical protein